MRSSATDLLINTATFEYVVPEITDADKAQAREDLAYWNTAIILAPDTVETATIRATVEALVGPGQLIGGVWLWAVGEL